MQVKRFPHEFLARWGRDGQLQGYHVVPVDILCDDLGVPLRKPTGENQMETFGQAQTLEAAGLVLTDLLSLGLQTALKAVDRYKAEGEQARVDLAAAVKAMDAAVAQVAALQAELAALKMAAQTP